MSPDVLNLFVTSWVYSAVIAYARIGTAILLIPGYGDARIPTRIRLVTSILITMALVPALSQPQIGSATVTTLGAIITTEVIIGIFIATIVKIFMATLNIVAAKIGMIAGLSNALSPSDGPQETSASLAGLLYMGTLALIFSTNIHHLMLSGVLTSYLAIPVGHFPIADMVQQLARISADIFYIAVAVSAPFLLFSVLFNASLGLANRVMPSMQVFFVAGPTLIVFGLAILAMSSAHMMDTVSLNIANWLQDFVK